MILEVVPSASREKVLKSATFNGSWEVRTLADAGWTAAINETGLPAWLKPNEFEGELPSWLQIAKRKVAGALIDRLPDTGGRTNLDNARAADMALADYWQSQEQEETQARLWLPGLHAEQALFSLFDYPALALNRDPRKLNAADYMVKQGQAAGVLPLPEFLIGD